MSAIEIFSAFSGVGGLELEFMNDDNFELVGLSEIDKRCSQVLEYHSPHVFNYGDISKINYADLPSHKILIGGFPCTDVSFQGKMAGFSGTKSSLFKHLLSILDAKSPRYAIFENVKALLSSAMSWEFNYVKTEIEKRGYDVHFKVIDSSDFGLPQQRERVFFFCIKKEYSKLSGDSLHAAYEPDKIKSYQKQNRLKNLRIIAWSKSTRAEHIDYRIREDDLINTLTTGKGCNGFSTGNLVYDESTGELRDLTPSECEAAMGWPHNWTKFGVVNDDVIEMSDSARYSMCGNGVVSACVGPIKDLILLNEEKLKDEKRRKGTSRFLKKVHNPLSDAQT